MVKGYGTVLWDLAIHEAFWWAGAFEHGIFDVIPNLVAPGRPVVTFAGAELGGITLVRYPVRWSNGKRGLVSLV